MNFQDEIMSLREELASIAESVASNPRVSTGVSTVTTGLGVASATELINGPLSTIAMVAGVIATVMLWRVHLASHRNMAIQKENEILRNKILRKELIKLGGDPDAESEPDE